MAESRPAGGSDGRGDATPYYALFKDAPFPIALFGTDGRWVEANEAFRAVFGGDPPPGYNLLEDDVVERRGTMDGVRRAFAGETVRFPPRWHEGREGWMPPGETPPRVAFERTLFPIRGADGIVTHVALSFLDVTAQLVRQEKRHEQASRILESAMVGVWVFDRDGRTSFMNERMASIVGVTPEEGLAMPVAELVPAEMRAALAERLAARKDKTITAEERFRRRDGTEGWAMFESGPVFDAEGRFDGILATVVDITERRLAEAQLRQAHKMEAVGRLAGGIAHDFNNLLSVILSYCDTLIPEWDGTSAGADLGQIRKAGLRAAELTRQLLAFSRQQVLKLTLVDVNTVVESLLGMLTRLLGRNIQVHSLLSDDIWGVTADSGQLEQVLVNLVLNARDAMPSGGTLTVETSNLDLNGAVRSHPELAAGKYVRVAVRDTGIGMDPSVRSRVFDPFFTTKEAGRGTGLGLSTAFGIVEQFGGHIGVESQPGIGSTFTVYLPEHRVTKVAPPSQPPRPTSEVVLKETILLVDDDEQVRGAATRILTLAGYHVLAAESADAALALSERHEGPIHLLLTDVVLPNRTGRDVAAHVTLQRPETRVLFTSGYAGDAITRRGVLEQGASFVAKPWTAEALARKVREVLDERTREDGVRDRPSEARPK
jgi:PAS domain S-box-containing protein